MKGERLSLPTDDEIASMTPMMGQYYSIKKSAADAIIFFRMGDFYEIFGEDALDVAPKLDLALTSRDRGQQVRIPFCGVPHHSAKSYWLKLLSLGYKVAIADQVEDPDEAKGLVKREITRIFTPGCIDDLDALRYDQPNYLMAVVELVDSKHLALAVADVSTGELRAGLVQDPQAFLGMVQRFRPKELVTRRFFKSEMETLLADYIKSEPIVFGLLPEAILRDKGEQARVLRRLGDPHVAPAAHPVIAALLTYVQSLHASIDQFGYVRELIEPGTMSLNEIARRDLELFETSRRRSREGSLMAELDETLTPMGARALHHSLTSPFLSLAPIAKRQSGIKFLLANDTVLDEFRKVLKGAPDLERLATRVLGGRSSPLELAKIRTALSQACEAGRILGSAVVPDELTDAMAGLSVGRGIVALLERTLSDNPRELGGELGCFAEGVDADFDELRERALFGEQKILEYELKLRESTGINSLKIKGHKTYGLLIEVTKSNLTKVPEYFIRRQTMVNNERFVTLELQELDESLGRAKDEAEAKELELFQNLVVEIKQLAPIIKNVSEVLAEWDLVQGLAHKARSCAYVSPEFSESGEIKLIASRHPVIESFVGRHDFTPNDLLLTEKHKSIVITGPNMAGKSTIMRQVAILALMHQIGSFVPAEEAVLPIFDQIFTRVGASDDLAQGKSTFMVEMSEASMILRQATSKSLVILDEVGRGTSTEDGMAIALAILEDLSERVGCFCLFATHFHDLIAIAKDLGSVRFVQTEVHEGTAIRFTHRIVEGAANNSFGVEVAMLAGIPDRVIARARRHLQSNQIKPPPGIGVLSRSSMVDEHAQEVVSILEKININRTTPMQALAQIAKLQEILAKNSQMALFS